MAETQRAFSRALRALRQQRGLTQEELGLQSGLGRTYVSELERMVKTPSLKTLDTIATYFGLKLSDLMLLVEEEMKHEQSANAQADP